MQFLKKIISSLFSPSAGGLYMILFAVAIGVATFIENDFGTSSAQKVVFTSRWFELLLVLFCGSLVANIIRFRMIPQKKWALFTFHAAMIVIIIGAGVTRYFGSEGMMHIREDSASNSFLSRETYLVFEAQKGGEKFVFDEPVLFATLGDNTMKNSYLLAGQQVDVEVLDFMPNPAENMVDDDEKGLPTLKIVIGGANGREEYYVQQSQRKKIRGTLFNFNDIEVPGAFNIKYQNGQLSFASASEFVQRVMATQAVDTLVPNMYHPLKLRSLYSSGNRSFVFGMFSPHARVEVISADLKMASTSLGGVRMKISTGGETEEFMVVGSQGVEGRPRPVTVGGMNFAVSYGAKKVTLPFSIALRDFIMEKYPGTNSASSYASEVTLIDPRENLNEDYRIYMNNILNYGGYRFFQSSFDKDEFGTYLSVNHDAPGTLISYIGYALLTIGLILVFFNKRSRFQQLQRNIKNMRQPQKAMAVFIGLLFFVSPSVNASPPSAEHIIPVNYEHAKKFGELILQDHRGRFKPMNTYASEILRKLSRKESYNGMTAEQVVLGMAAHPKDWYHVPLFKLGHHEETKNILGVDGKMATYSDFFEVGGKYKLQEHVRNAYNTPQRDRGVFEKELMKLDEKVNIASMVFSGRFMKVFPMPGDPSHTWRNPMDFEKNPALSTGSPFAEKFYPAYIPTLQNALHEDDWNLANQLLDELDNYQQNSGGDIIPSESKINAELLLNKLNVFSRLGKIYGLLGFAFLILLFTSVFKPNLNLKLPTKIAFWLFVGAFILHLFGLGLRWYVSGRAPWSNGYESMIYIAFTTVLAGLIFSRKSLGGLAATSVLSATILMVAGLSWLDPEITPLVPVLKSYWLTIHVSLIAGSYGFLMLGALVGVLNLIFMIFGNQNNGKNVYRIVKEMTYISEMTLIGGLFMISIGTYLGGVWANESWGRYWGWDAKETWALVTILIYAFILHMRFIPGFRGVYAFNVSTLFGWASVIMTYFGVNYYLSGLHSYAAGDPMPIPPAIYYSVIILTIISLLAFWRHKVYLKKSGVRV